MADVAPAGLSWERWREIDGHNDNPKRARAVVAWAVMAAFAAWYEGPALTRQFGNAYLDYRRTVPAWLPRRPRNADRRQAP